MERITTEVIFLLPIEWLKSLNQVIPQELRYLQFTIFTIQSFLKYIETFICVFFSQLIDPIHEISGPDAFSGPDANGVLSLIKIGKTGAVQPIFQEF